HRHNRAGPCIHQSHILQVVDRDSSQGTFPMLPEGLLSTALEARRRLLARLPEATRSQPRLMKDLPRPPLPCQLSKSQSVSMPPALALAAGWTPLPRQADVASSPPGPPKP